MSLDEHTVSLTLHVDAAEGTDAEETDRVTRQLLGEVWDLQVESVELATEGSTPKGSKSGEAIALGALAVQVLPVLLPKLLDFLQAWLLRGGDRKLRIRTQVGDQSVEVEVPASMSQADLKGFVDTLTGALAKKKSAN